MARSTSQQQRLAGALDGFSGNVGPTVGGLVGSTVAGALTGAFLRGAGVAGGAAARGGLSAARAASAATQQFVYDTGLPFARGFSRALVNGPFLASSDLYSTAILGILRGGKGGVQELLEQSRRFERVARGYVRNELNETVIRTQQRVGAADRGFDFISFSGTGANAKLFINEVKFVTGRARSRKFSVFNVGKTAGGKDRTGNFDTALGIARDAIIDLDLDRITRDALLRQLRPNGSAVIRLIGSTDKATHFDPKIIERIGKATGFVAGEGFNL